jgi:riboflavin synthase
VSDDARPWKIVFTGIIERIGVIAAVRSVPGGRRLRIDAGPVASDCVIGASVSVNGVCLTVADKASNTLDFDVIAETLESSTLGSRNTGDHVNLERSLKVGDRLDGHFVQGHVDGKATVDRVIASSRESRIQLRPHPSIMPYIVPKGSVAIDGVSLTIAATGGDAFSVALVPTTLDRTTLSSLETGAVVNIETDILARTVVHYLSSQSGSTGLTLEALRKAGFA